MNVRELILQLIGIGASTIAAIILLWMLAEGVGEPEINALLAFAMAWVSGIQCGEISK